MRGFGAGDYCTHSAYLTIVITINNCLQTGTLLHMNVNLALEKTAVASGRRITCSVMAETVV